MLDYIKAIREGLKDPKKKAITKLILYAIFFAFVFMLISNSENRTNYKPDTEFDENIVYSYNYTYNINENNVLKQIIGKSYDENDSYNYDKIKELIDKSEFIEKTTYKDNTIKTIYNITANDYYDTCIENCDKTISITVYEKENINNVVIDLSSINNYVYIVDINYENIEVNKK